MSEELRNYDGSAIETLDWYTHIRTRPGMYIGSQCLTTACMCWSRK